MRPGFWESLWADWSPGYDPADDVAELRKYVTADNSPTSSVRTARRSTPVRRPDAQGEEAATMQPPRVPTLYLHGADDGGWVRTARRLRCTCPRPDRPSKSSTTSVISCIWSSPSDRGQDRDWLSA